jgi:predicted solute-binding protein
LKSWISHKEKFLKDAEIRGISIKSIWKEVCKTKNEAREVIEDYYNKCESLSKK